MREKFRRKKMADSVNDLKDTVVNTLNDKLKNVDVTMYTLDNPNLNDPNVSNTLNFLKAYRAGLADALKLVSYDFDVALYFD